MLLFSKLLNFAAEVIHPTLTYSSHILHLPLVDFRRASPMGVAKRNYYSLQPQS